AVPPAQGPRAREQPGRRRAAPRPPFEGARAAAEARERGARAGALSRDRLLAAGDARDAPPAVLRGPLLRGDRRADRAQRDRRAQALLARVGGAPRCARALRPAEAGPFACAGGQPMTDGQGKGAVPEIDVEVERVLASAGRPAARPGFPADRRRRFLAPEPAAAPATVLATDPVRRRSVAFRVVSLLAAAVILAVGYFLLEPSVPRWKVLDLAEGSVVKVDGAAVSTGDRVALARTLQRAREIEIEKGDLIVQIEDIALFDLGAGTRASFVGFDRKTPGAPFELKALSGRLRGRTGPGFQGRKMMVAADLMDVTVTGTAFAVDYEPHGTCICCLHGDVVMVSKAAGPEPHVITPDHMCLIYRDARSPKWGAPPEHHAVPLRALEQRAL